MNVPFAHCGPAVCLFCVLTRFKRCVLQLTSHHADLSEKGSRELEAAAGAAGAAA